MFSKHSPAKHLSPPREGRGGLPAAPLPGLNTSTWHLLKRFLSVRLRPAESPSQRSGVALERGAACGAAGADDPSDRWAGWTCDPPPPNLRPPRPEGPPGTPQGCTAGQPSGGRPRGVQVADGRGGGPGAGPTRWRFRGTPPPFPGIGAFLPETLHLPTVTGTGSPSFLPSQIFCGPSARRTRPATTTTTTMAVVAELGAVDLLQLLAPPCGSHAFPTVSLPTG